MIAVKSARIGEETKLAQPETPPPLIMVGLIGVVHSESEIDAPNHFNEAYSGSIRGMLQGCLSRCLEMRMGLRV